MNKKINFFVGSLLAVGTLMLLSTCASNPPMMKKAATAPAASAFSSNGERIYFTSSSDRGTPITYSDGPELNGGMMGRGGQLACVSCHGPDGRGGKHNMGMMRLMMAKDIRWSALQSEFDAGKFSLALTKGQDPDGTQLNRDMPRWNIGADDQADLITYLKTLP